jgi:hypothetical protein
MTLNAGSDILKLTRFKEMYYPLPGISGKKCNGKKDYMKHMKEENCNHISECIENENGSCRFSSNNCWYKHTKVMSKEENETDVSGIKTSDLLKRLFNMMEAFADRMTTLENQK